MAFAGNVPQYSARSVPGIAPLQPWVSLFVTALPRPHLELSCGFCRERAPVLHMSVRQAAQQHNLGGHHKGDGGIVSTAYEVNRTSTLKVLSSLDDVKIEDVTLPIPTASISFPAVRN